MTSSLLVKWRKKVEAALGEEFRGGGDQRFPGPQLLAFAQREAAGGLTPHLAWRGAWDDAAGAVYALPGRRLHGKAVLDVA